MSIQGTYKPTGTADTRGMGEALNQGLINQKANFKDIFGGVEDLLKTVEKGYVEDNTLKVQEYLRNNIKNAGLGAEAPEIDQIAGTFGKLIDKDAIGKTIASTREGMLSSARDEATMAAGKAFGENEDLGAATNAFREKLITSGMNPYMANVEAGKWSQDNKFMAEQAANTNAMIVSDFGTKVLDTIKSHQGTASSEEVLNFMADELPVKLRDKAITETNKMLAERSKLTPEQQLEHDHIQNRVTQTKQAFNQQYELLKGQAAQKVKDLEPVRPETKAQMIKLGSDSPAGIMEAIAKDAKSFLGGLWGRLDGTEVVQDLQPHADALIRDYNVPASDAYAMALESYQEAKAAGGQAMWDSGASLPPGAMQERMHAHLATWAAQQKAIAEQNNVHATGLAELARIDKEGEDLMYSIKKGDQFSNISRKPFDANSAFNKSRFGNNVAPAVQPVPDKKPVQTVSKSNSPSPIKTFAEAKAQALKNTAKVPVDVKADKGKANLKAAAVTPAAVVTPAVVEKKKPFNFFKDAGSINRDGSRTSAPVETSDGKWNLKKIIKDFHKETVESRNNHTKLSDLATPEQEAKFLKEIPEGKTANIMLKKKRVTVAKVKGKLVYLDSTGREL